MASGGCSFGAPFEHCDSLPAELQSSPWEDAFDWYAFVCTSCGDHICVSRDSGQSLDEFDLACAWIYGDPPVCTACQERARYG